MKLGLTPLIISFLFFSQSLWAQTKDMNLINRVPANILDTMSTTYDAKMREIEATLRLSEEQARLEVNRELLQMYRRLLGARAVSQESFLEAQSLYEQSLGKITELSGSIEVYKGQQNISGLRLRFASGEKIDIKDLAQSYADYWKGRSNEALGATARSEADYALAGFRMNILRELQSSNSASQQEYLRAVVEETRSRYSIQMWKERKKAADCFYDSFMVVVENKGEVPIDWKPEHCF